MLSEPILSVCRFSSREDLPIPSERFNKHALLSTAAFPSRWVCYSESDQRIYWVIVSEIETLRQEHWSSLNITDTSVCSETVEPFSLCMCVCYNCVTHSV